MNIVNPCNEELNVYAFIDASLATPVITKAKNVSSLTDIATGKTQLNFANTLASTNYSCTATVGPFDSTAAISALEYDASAARSASNIEIWTAYDLATLFPCKFSIMITGA